MIRFKQGFFFPFTMRIFCGILILVSFGILIQIPVFGFILICIFGLAFGVVKGIEFDIKQNIFRSYVALYGIKTGKWLPLQDYPFICLLRRNYSMKTGLKGASINSNFSTSEVILTDTQYRKKIFIIEMPSEEAGVKEAERIAQLLGKDFVPYAPKRHPNNPRRKKL